MARAPDAGRHFNAWSIQRDGDDDVSALNVTFDADFTRLEPTFELEPNSRYFLTLSGFEDGQPIPIQTGDGPDLEPPPAPTVTRSSTREDFGDFGLTPCSSPRDGATTASFVVEIRELHGVRLERNGALAGRNIVFVDDGETSVSETSTDAFDQDYEITAIDLAGNESEPTAVPLSLGCPGACSSTSAAPLVVVGLALCVRRRRPPRAA